MLFVVEIDYVAGAHRISALGVAYHVLEEDVAAVAYVYALVGGDGAVGYVDVANYNSPAQVVITGDDNAVKAASEWLLANGVRRVVPLAVSGAFHSKFMENAGKEFASFVAEFSLNDASIPVITNVDAEETVKAEDFKSKMPRQISSSVHWTQTIQKMVAEGVDTFIEIGPGKTLSGFVKKITREAKVFNVEDMASLEKTLEGLGK